MPAPLPLAGLLLSSSAAAPIAADVGAATVLALAVVLEVLAVVPVLVVLESLGLRLRAGALDSFVLLVLPLDSRLVVPLLPLLPLPLLPFPLPSLTFPLPLPSSSYS